jgi:hypothetical protein
MLQVTREVFEASKGRLKVVGRAGVGVDNVDLTAATEVRCGQPMQHMCIATMPMSRIDSPTAWQSKQHVTFVAALPATPAPKLMISLQLMRCPRLTPPTRHHIAPH